MAKRPKPTGPFIHDVCGGNNAFTRGTHHGLAEMRIGAIYVLLDLSELVAFAASSWKSREKEYGRFADMVENADGLYEIFSDVYKIGFPWLNKMKDISPRHQSKWEKSNPYNGKCLEARLARVRPEGVAAIKKKLQEPVKKWVFDCEYDREKRARGGDNYGLEVMTFQTVYPKKGKVIPNFEKEIAKIIGAYDQRIVNLSIIQRLESA